MEVELPLKPLRLKMKSTKTNFVQDIFQMKAAVRHRRFRNVLRALACTAAPFLAFQQLPCSRLLVVLNHQNVF